MKAGIRDSGLGIRRSGDHVILGFSEFRIPNPESRIPFPKET